MLLYRVRSWTCDVVGKVQRRKGCGCVCVVGGEVTGGGGGYKGGEARS
jgi:hypothetical protein